MPGGSSRHMLSSCHVAPVGWDTLTIPSPKLGFPGGSVVKNLPEMQETWVRSLDQEDPLEEEMATRSSILAWEIPWTERPVRLQSIGSQKSQT